MILKILVIVLSYLMGSLCTAVIVSRIFSLPDPRTLGSKNPGATNVLRLAGKQYAIIVLLGDMLKGLLPVLFVKFMHGGPLLLGFTALAAVMGHMYPVFFDFKGGKGVATALGACLGVNFIFGVVVLSTWLLVANFTRYSSLASLTATGLAPFFALVLPNGSILFLPLLILAVFILYKHRENASRLINGTEHKISLKHHSLEDEIEATLEEQAQEEQKSAIKESIQPEVDLQDETQVPDSPPIEKRPDEKG
ncbi:MAG: glycerol-3-phosphate 1-O-acyltransferase PlsY [Legionella sp.]|nr:glycerol-3-phosphate 1-O-acyltransferase PlsY [Legionella sp.]